MCETNFKDFSFQAMTGSDVKTRKPDVAWVRDALREN
jgi:hypothetical protein